MKLRNRLPLTPLSFQILVALGQTPLHGYGIIKEIEKTSGQPLQSSTGTLYLAIHRLVEEELVEEDRSSRDGSDGRRRYYRLTSLGRDVALAEAQRLIALLGAARTKRLLRDSHLEDLLSASSEPSA